MRLILDPGHGPHCKQKGAIGEMRLTWEVAARLRDALQGFDVHMTRIAYEESPSLIERCSSANQFGPEALFLSIHFNGCGDLEVRGLETYCCSDLGEVAARPIHDAVRASCGFRDRHVRRVDKTPATWDDFFVLRHTEAPAVLIELGYLTNSYDSEYVHSKDGMESIVSGLCLGIRAAMSALDAERKR